MINSVRLTCPSCGRDFKTEIDTNDLQWVLAAQCRRMGLEVGEQPNDPAKPLRIHCPYCSFEDEARQMHTEDTVEYLKRILDREYASPQIQKMFSGFEDLSGHRWWLRRVPIHLDRVQVYPCLCTPLTSTGRSQPT